MDGEKRLKTFHFFAIGLTAGDLALFLTGFLALTSFYAWVYDVAMHFSGTSLIYAPLFLRFF